MVSDTRFPATPFGNRSGMVQPQKSLTKIMHKQKKRSFFRFIDCVWWYPATRAEMKRDSLKAVPHEITEAIILVSLFAARGKRAGIVQPQNHFIRKIPNTNTPATRRIIGGSPRHIILRSFIIITFYKLSINQGKLLNETFISRGFAISFSYKLFLS